MRHLITYTAALAALVFLLAPLAEAGDEGRRGSRGVRSSGRSGSGGSRARSPFSRPSRSTFAPPSRSRSGRSIFQRRSSPSRSQPTLRQRVPSPSPRATRGSSASSPGASRATRFRFSTPRSRGSFQSSGRPAPARAPSVLYGPRGRSSGGSQAARATRGGSGGSSSSALGRLRARNPGLRSTTPGRSAVSSGRGSASPRGDTSTGARFGGRSGVLPGRTTRGPATAARSGIVRGSSGRSSALRSGGVARTRLGSGNVRTGSVRRGSGSSRFGASTRLGGRTSLRHGSALVSGGRRSGAAIGGTVRTRPGTRGRVGRSYRIRSHGHHHRHHDHHSHFGFYFAWNPYYVPYYRVYPRYGLYFGYGLTYYGPAYETVFVDATDYYYPTEVVVRETVVEEAPVEVIEEAPAPVVEEVPAGPVPQDAEFPPPAEQAAEDGAAPANGERKPHPDFEPAVQDFLGGRYQQALRRLDTVLAAEPDNGEAWLAAMHANFALGRYGTAGTALAKAAALQAFPRGYRFDPRPLYAKSGNFDRAVQALEAHVTRKPDDADALLVRAYLHVALGERTQAQDLIQKVLRIRPADETAPALALALLPPPPPPQPDQPGR